MTVDETATPPAAVPEPRARRLRRARAGDNVALRPTGGYARRFAAVYLVLALCAGIAVGALVVLLARPGAAPDPIWSAWQPAGSDTAKARQIADRITRTYRLENGEQLVVALGGPPSVVTGGDESSNAFRVSTIVIRPDTSAGVQEEDDFEVIEVKGAHQFVLCGLGHACSIAYGTPSPERHSLLRREALELALYTFRYSESVESVAVFLPPPPSSPKSEPTAEATAVFLRRGDVAEEVRLPLRTTLEPATPPIGQMTSADLASVNRLTRPNLYTYEYQQAQDGSAILVLDPIVSSG
ncbi:MAG: hypothetical protein EXQ81_02385 [Thermoleophilia bacterium]|nr:hypothetical protein [Thermoleophilia bacterium]